MTVSCKRIGSAGPIRILLHGFASNSGSFLNLVPFFRCKGWLLLVDLPGHGKSSPPTTNMPLDGMIEATLRAVQEHCPERFQLVGHSLGTLIASHIASAIPEQIEGLYLISCAGVGPKANLSFFRRIVVAVTPQELLAGLSMPYIEPPGNLDNIAEATFTWLQQPGVRPYLENLVKHVLQYEADLETPPDKRITVLGLWGRDDSILPVENAPWLPAGLPLTVLDGIGHAPHVEAPADVARWLLRSNSRS